MSKLRAPQSPKAKAAPSAPSIGAVKTKSVGTQQALSISAQRKMLRGWKRGK